MVLASVTKSLTIRSASLGLTSGLDLGLGLDLDLDFGLGDLGLVKNSLRKS